MAKPGYDQLCDRNRSRTHLFQLALTSPMAVLSFFELLLSGQRGEKK